MNWESLSSCELVGYAIIQARNYGGLKLAERDGGAKKNGHICMYFKVGPTGLLRVWKSKGAKKDIKVLTWVVTVSLEREVEISLGHIQSEMLS